MLLYIMQIVRILLQFRQKIRGYKIDINAKNSEGFTAFDMLQGDNKWMKIILRYARWDDIQYCSKLTSHANYSNLLSLLMRRYTILFSVAQHQSQMKCAMSCWWLLHCLSQCPSKQQSAPPEEFGKTTTFLRQIIRLQTTLVVNTFNPFTFNTQYTIY